jgi:two-component system sensor histidine kinase KdpD
MRMAWDRVARLAAGVGGIVVVTIGYARWLPVANAATVSASFLLIVLLVATTSPFWIAAVTSLAAVLSFNFFFLPPVRTLTIAEPQNWLALGTFLAVSLIASNLSTIARKRTQEAVGRRDELTRLFDLSRDVLVMTDTPDAMSVLARSIARRFDVDFAAIALPRTGTWRTFEGGAAMVHLDPKRLTSAFALAETSSSDEQTERGGPLDPSQTSPGDVRMIPIRTGTTAIGLLAIAGRPIERGTLNALAGLVAIAIERAQFLEERTAAELTKQSEALKTALLASLGHDLRTPLTAIRIAATNLHDGGADEGERIDQSDLILTEVERLSRLFQNVLEMARIDAGALAMESRWTHPSEIIAAAREHVDQALQGHQVNVSIDRDIPVRVDPRLTASALAYVLENAAHYAPPGSAIDVSTTFADGTFEIGVRDRGPGIAVSDLPHVFERFYRGAAAKSHMAGTGMGLWIASGLVAVEHGRIRAENCPDGGARFTIAIPTVRKAADDTETA